MALHNLKIVVVDGGKNGSYKSKNAGVDKEDSSKTNYKDTNLYKLLHAKETIKNKVTTGMSPTSVMALSMSVKVATQAVKQAANYYISDIGRQNGDDNYQAMVNRTIEVVSDHLSVLSGAASGAIAGSMFGGIGAGIGLVLGATSSAISLGFKYAERNRNYQFEMFQQNNGIAYNISRANFNALAGRVR